MELIDKANNYAIEKSNEAMVQTIAQAYMDGYKEGYQAHEEKISVDFQNDKTEYVDLGLPSGTLWAADYEKDGDKRIYLPYDNVSASNIPTEEDWNELLKTCRWDYHDREGYFACVGPSGREIPFYCSGHFRDEKSHQYTRASIFWIKDESAGFEKNAVEIWPNENTPKQIVKIFKGYKCPIRLVRKKIVIGRNES